MRPAAVTAAGLPEWMSRVATILHSIPNRILFGTDTVAPTGPAPYYAVYDMWKPVRDRLTADASFQIRKGNFAN